MDGYGWHAVSSVVCWAIRIFLEESPRGDFVIQELTAMTSEEADAKSTIVDCDGVSTIVKVG
jgi:hypothetical protein